MHYQIKHHEYMAELARLASKTEARVAEVMRSCNMPVDACKYDKLAERSKYRAQRHESLARILKEGVQ